MLEVWRPIPGYDGYEASNLGRVRSYRLRSGRRAETPSLMNQRLGLQGYFDVSPVKRTGIHPPPVHVHVLVLRAFRGLRPPGQCARHLNGNPRDNRLVNLRWGTYKQNSEDRERHGRTARGLRNGKYTQPHKTLRGDMHPARLRPETRPRGVAVNTAKLTEEQVRAVRAMPGKVRDIAPLFGISKSMVSYIKRREHWKHVL